MKTGDALGKEPAFPHPNADRSPGMDTRTYIATAALQGLCAEAGAEMPIFLRNRGPKRTLAELRALYAFEAVKLADALLEELAK